MIAFQPNQALALNPLILSHIFQVLDKSNPDHMTFWAVLLVSFFLLLRKSNIVIDKLSDFDPIKLLCRQDIKLHAGGAWVTLRWSKTNQFGQHLTFPLPLIPGLVLCPVSALHRMWGLRPGQFGPCFRRADNRPFMYYQYHTLLRGALKAAGYQAHLYSSHSARRG